MATNELNDLFNLEQEIAVNMLELDWFDGIDKRIDRKYK